MSAQQEIFNVIPGLREWIKSTKLFNALVTYSGNPHAIIVGFEGLNEEITMQLSNVRIFEPEDLPPEVLGEFIKNSPFYTPENVMKVLALVIKILKVDPETARKTLLN